MSLPDKDRDVLRGLAEQKAAIAAEPINGERAELWRRLNRLEPTRPLVWINEICWNEMDYEDELTLVTTDPWARGQELGLRRMLYQWRHLPGDMVVDDYMSSPHVAHSTGFGISEKAYIVRTDETSGTVSRQFHPQLVEPGDIEKIRMPEVTYDADATQDSYERMCGIYGDILPVRVVGRKNWWFAPWDLLIRWWGVEDAMMDLAVRPDMVHKAMARLVDAYMCELDQIIELDMLTLNNDNTRIGSGGYGYIDELPEPTADYGPARTQDMWGCATAQIFSEVSPEMHWEFALQYEAKWLERWGLTYYGCCEPLDLKVEILRRVPNLRKLSMSAWIDAERAVANVGTDYVMSRKPNPAVFATDEWQPDVARRELIEFLEVAEGCRVELILKDISTVRYDPERLWDWEGIAMEVAGA
ncbi:hypothetical protein CMK11_01840 [Candidatus Poribacteria bacterium]|nr:hypothetical protein [Candidatus Poribacteria bacterium]